MTTLNLTKTLPPDQTSFSLIATQFGYTAEWAQQPIGQAIEIWQNTTNSRSTATKVGTVYDTYFDSGPLTVGQNYYIWTRRLSNLGTPGNWDYGETAGQVVVPTGVTIVDMGVYSTSSAGAMSGDAIYNTTVSSYNTWNTKNIFTATVLDENATLFVNRLTLVPVITTPTGGADFDGMVMSARVYFYDNTAAANITNYYFDFDLANYMKISGTWNEYDKSGIIHHPMVIPTGFASQFVPGHSISMKVSAMIARGSSTATAGLVVKCSTSYSSSYFA